MGKHQQNGVVMKLANISSVLGFFRKHKTLATLSLAVITLVAVSATAMAFTEPVEGDLFYELYDLAMNKIFSGAAGVVIAAIMVVGAFVMMGMGRGLLVPLMLLLCGAAVFFVKPIVLSFGYSLATTVPLL
jgi:hypothetical protein